ncbi:MAG: hypothetical protein HDS60_03675 [Barnesiella sp.]|nr:hypothetical protein [Barnesiella sp.]
MKFVIVGICIFIWFLFSYLRYKQKAKESLARRERAYKYFEEQRLQHQDETLADIVVKVKGISYRSQEEICAARFCDLGDTLILAPEPSNEVDSNAIKVLTMEGVHIGYVEACHSEYILSKIGHISECKIIRKTQHEIPFIDIGIKFSREVYSQPRFIPKEYQCSPEDKMRNLSVRRPDSYKYRRVPLSVNGLYEHDRPTIAKIRAARKGDKVILKKGECNELYPYRVDIYLEDGTYIGYADDLSCQEVYMLFEHRVESIVQSPVGEETKGNLFVYVFFPDELPCPDEARVRSGISFHYTGAYKEVKYAQTIRRTDPLAALDILLPIAEREKGIDAKIECIACYYTLKDWDSRIDIIHKTLAHIDSLTEEDLPPNDLAYMKKHQSETLTKQLEFSQKRLESQMRKKKR